MRNIKLIIEYDGTAYAGWQVQPNGVTVQETLERSLAQMLGGPVRLHSSGRTDAGVHAMGMVAAFKTEKNLPLRAFSDGLNSLLPRDIAVRGAEEMPATFHPRFDAVGKHYRYTIFTGRYRSPLQRLYAWHCRRSLDVAAMRRAAGHFVGEKDFAAFRGAGCAAKTTVRRVEAVDIAAAGEFLQLDVRGNGFLKQMVRMMVGTLVEVGTGRLAPDDVRRFFETPVPAAKGVTAPSHGLCLVEVYY
ncbi:tRNA pseudouridine synthase A [Geotalea uraniireducens]|uniref:tRNA pseudouridine synthase A n=1 Tax=Geotalea uraniireducens TaxID=351604 RepID=A0ABM8ENV7_9BACT|nr:tRNA pseudouridine(38-40) synthase TruA [Geotalea uraniireducens]BDV44287.1 tRNA pseudouridine synthase A [Geotalea uraniireducens]